MDHVDEILAQWRRERPDLDVTPMGPLGRLGRLEHHLGREMEATFAAHGLSASGFDVLATLRRSGKPYALTPGELLEAMLISSGTVTNRVDQLEKAGLVERVQDSRDRRRILVGLTESGFRVIEAAVADHVRTQARLAAALDGDELRALDRLLAKFLVAFED